MNKLKASFSYLIGGIACIVFIAILISPEISGYFKNRGLPSESDLKQEALRKFDQYKVAPIKDDDQRIKFAELGNTKFPYSMNYSYLTAPTHLDEKLYLYSQGQEDWILVSETKRTFENKELDEISDWNVITP